MNNVRYMVVVALIALLTACGGGGGGGGSSSSAGGVTTVSGVASKGIFKKGGTVAVYPVSGGVKGSSPLATGKIIDDNGSYSVNIGSYSGPIVVETYGEYADEATGSTLTIPASAPLRAALGFVTTGQSFNLPVTPLTDLAYRQAGPLTSANIQAANDMISYTMRIDIINTIPVAATSTAFATASQSQKDYSLILAAVSQTMATQGATLEQTLSSLNNGLATTATAAALNSALTAYIANPNNRTGEKTVPATLQNVGTVGKKLTLAISGDSKIINSVQAFSATLTLPDGLLLRTDADGLLLTTVLKTSGSAATAKNANIIGHYVAADPNRTDPRATLTITLLAPNGGLTAGDLITIICDTAGGVTPPDAAAVIINPGYEFKDQNGAALPGPALPVLSLY